MKFTKRFVLLALVASLFLVGCGDDGGFSIAKSDETAEQQSTMGDDLRGDKETDNNANSGATGAKEDHNQEEVTKEDNEPVNQGGTGSQIETPAVDLGNHVTTFIFRFVKSDESMYANVSFEDDPFDQKYDFSYYTVNDKKLEHSEYRLKEMVDDVETYKIYLGSNESGTFVLKFYNSTGKQYGRVNVTVQFKGGVNSTPYISVAFNLVQVRAISIVFSVQNVFKKIGDFFSNLFNGDRISLSN